MPRCSIYGIFMYIYRTYIWPKLMVNVGKYTSPIEQMGWWNSTTSLWNMVEKKHKPRVLGSNFCWVLPQQKLDKKFFMIVPHGSGGISLWVWKRWASFSTWLGGGFKHFLFSPLYGEDSHFELRIFFQMGWFNHHPAKREDKKHRLWGV